MATVIKEFKKGGGWTLEGVTTVIPSKAEFEALKWAMLAKSTDKSRMSIVHVLFMENGIAATDGWRLHIVTYPKDFESCFPVGLYLPLVVNRKIVVLEPDTFGHKFPDVTKLSAHWKSIGVPIKKANESGKYAAIFNMNPSLVRDALSIAGSGEVFIELHGGPIYIHYSGNGNIGSNEFEYEAFIMPMFEKESFDKATGHVVFNDNSQLIERVD